LVVDAPHAARGLAEQLRKFDCEVLGIAATEEEALALAARTPPDLVLIEVGASWRAGEDLAEALGKQLDVPILRLAGQAPGLWATVETTLAYARLEREHRALCRRAEVHQRAVALGTLAAYLTREREPPLNFVIGSQQYALRELDALSELFDAVSADRRELARELAEEIGSALRDSISGVERLRASALEFGRLSQPRASRTRSLDVRTALDTALALTGAELAARARVVRDFGACPLVVADEVSLAALFVNLLSNAAHAIAQGAIDENQVRIVTRTSAYGGALIEVRDSGCGIPASDLRRIFEPFFTTGDPETSAGLGLSIVLDIVTSLGGSLVVDSKAGAGSTFRVLLPAAPEARMPGAPLAYTRALEPKASPPLRPDTRERVLLIDDEPILLDALARALEGPYAVTRAVGGRAALELLSAGKEYDLLLCDLMMPGMTGVDLCLVIEQQFPSAARRMAFMTGGAFTLPAQQFISAPGRCVLEKPFTNDELFAFIAKCLAR
jgi:signal transduction histidine kinase